MTVSDALRQNRFADVFGSPKGRPTIKVKDYLTPFLQEFIGRSPFLVLASANGEGHCDASPKGGRPGFVRVLDRKRLLIPDVAGNRLFQSYQNIDANPHVGLIFLIPGIEETVRVNGRVSIAGKEELDRYNVELSLYETDENARHLQGIIVEVEEAYPHCPRALKFSHLWDPGEITANRSRPLPDRVAGHYEA